jgi:hypothetical protein
MIKEMTFVGLAALVGSLVLVASAPADWHSINGTPNARDMSSSQVTIPGGLFSSRSIQCVNVASEDTIQKGDTQQGPVLVGAHVLVKSDISESCTLVGWFSTSGSATMSRRERQFEQNAIANTGITDSIKSTIQIKVMGKSGGSCIITIPAVTENEHLGSFSMEDSGNEVLLEGQAKGLVSKGEESTLCKENEVNGEITTGQLKEKVDFSELDTVTAPDGGPYWRHREGGKGEGAYIEAGSPEKVEGTGGEQKFTGEIAAIPFEINAKEEQASGIIYNNILQGQLKLALTYHEPRLIKPALKECTVKIGENNIVNAAGHLAWKWNGTKSQLEETKQSAQVPDVILTPATTEIAEGATELPKGQFTTVTFSKGGCGVLAGTFKVEGSVTGEPKPLHLEEWSKAPTITTQTGKRQQHFSNEDKFVGVETGPLFGGHAAGLAGTTELKAAKQEVAIFES